MKTNKYKVSVNGIPYVVEIEPMTATNQVAFDSRPTSTATNNVAPTPMTNGSVAQAPVAQPQSQAVESSNLSGESVVAPMQGKIVKIAVSVGQLIKKGHVIAVLEAMKMENEIMADRDAQIIDVHVKAGQPVEADDLLVTLA